MLASLFEFLFKYPYLIFEQGRFVFAASRSMRVAVIVAALAALYVVWTYRSLANVRAGQRAALLAIRTALILLVLFALLRPTLLLKVAVPQQNFVGVVIDDSRSMQIADHDGKPRADFVKDQVGRRDGPLLTELGKRFQLKIFRFSSSAERLQSASHLTFEGTATRVGEALDRVRDGMSGLNVAGVVLLSDGADNADATIDEPIAAMKSSGLPVFAVGVGRDRLTRDVQVTRAGTPRRVLKGSSLVVDVVVTQYGYAGAKVPLMVEDSGRIVSTQDITLPPDGESETIKVRFKTFETGPRVVRFRIPVQNSEEVPQNNQRDALIEVYDRREKILYLEGEPRPEPTFIRRAADLDDNLQVALLQRTAVASPTVGDKYLRLGVEGPEDLLAGFPATREELFQYRGMIIGSVEASAFTPEQHRMLEDFVNIRGGGLLALGGGLSFREGGWADTPMSHALPIVIEPPLAKSDPYAGLRWLIVRPTRPGQSHPATQITEREEDAPAKWRDLPPVTTINNIGMEAAKPGATVLLHGLDDKNREHIVLAFQRYGKGKGLVVPVQDTWQWRMGAKMAVEDKTFFTFWQRLLRWQVDGVPDRVMVTASPERVQRGEPFTLAADVMTPEFAGVNNGRITASVTSPSGRTESVAMEWTVKKDGEYRGTFTPAEDGVYRVTVGGADPAGKDVGRGATHLRVAPSDAEYFDAAMRPPLMRRIAEDTEGRYFEASDISRLVEAITYSGKGVTVTEDKELWDMPIILLGLLALMGGEWMYRRARGLA